MSEIKPRGRGQKGQKWDKVKGEWFYPEEVTPVQNTGITIEMLNDALAKQRQEIMESMGKKDTPAAPVAVTENNRNTEIKKSDIDESDLLDKPVFYYAWNACIILGSYREKGREIAPPYGNPIVLRQMPPQVEINDKGKRKELHWCSTKQGIWSKKENEFIRKHPFFAAGIVMESADDLKHEDVHKVSAKITIIGQITGLSKVEIIEMCKGRHIPQSNDFNEMRNQLIESLCSESLTKQRQFSEEIAKKSLSEKILAGVK